MNSTLQTSPISASQLVNESLRVFTKDVGKLIVLGWKPVVLLNFLGFAFGFIQDFFGIQWLLPIGGQIVYLVTISLFLLAVHRYRLLGWNSDTNRLRLRFDMR